MWLSEARADIPIHLMGPNPGPGHGGMSCASPSKPTFSMAWRHNRNAKNAQSRAKKEHFYGLRGHLVITLAGTAVAFTVTAANVDERDVVPNLYDKIRGL